MRFGLKVQVSVSVRVRAGIRVRLRGCIYDEAKWMRDSAFTAMIGLVLGLVAKITVRFSVSFRDKGSG